MQMLMLWWAASIHAVVIIVITIMIMKMLPIIKKHAWSGACDASQQHTCTHSLGYIVWGANMYSGVTRKAAPLPWAA